MRESPTQQQVDLDTSSDQLTAADGSHVRLAEVPRHGAKLPERQLLRQLTRQRLSPLPAEAAQRLQRADPPNAVDLELPTAISATPSSVGFVALLAAYRLHGGTVRGDDVCKLLGAEAPGDVTNLARQLASGLLLNFEWRQSFWVPVFQFEPGKARIRPTVRQLLAELRAAFNAWETAVWFVQPNSLLAGDRPVNLLDTQFPDVLHAARTDRMATGV